MNQYLKAGLIFIGAFLLFVLFTHRSEDTNKGIRKTFGQTEIETRQVETSRSDSAPAIKEKTDTSKALTNEEINDKMAAFFKNMPRVSELQNDTDAEVHETPEIVILAGRRLGEMRELFIQNPVRPEVEMGFYLKCSQDKEFFDSIRAVCAARVSKKYLELTGQKISPLLFDKRIANLKEQISL